MIAGVATDMCVHLTAMDAYMRGFKVWVPSDCTAAKGRFLSARPAPDVPGVQVLGQKINFPHLIGPVGLPAPCGPALKVPLGHIR